MDFYRVRKKWNDGKWAEGIQLCAYQNKEDAIKECTEERIEEGYKVYDPNGVVIYPIKYESMTNMLLKDQVIENEDAFDINELVTRNADIPYGKFENIVKNYSLQLDARIPAYTQIYAQTTSGGVSMYKIKPSAFKIVYHDEPKNKATSTASYFNLGYFANFSEDGQPFTLPVANLVADINESEVKPYALKYLKERTVKNGKLYFYASQNASDQFKHKDVSTLVVTRDGELIISQFNSLYNDEVAYAVSGAPIIRNGENAGDLYLEEGWDTSITRPTVHGFLGLKDDGYIYYFYKRTFNKNCISSGEVYNEFKDCGFTNLIKVDGGGSFYLKMDGNKIDATEGNRRINNIGVIVSD